MRPLVLLSTRAGYYITAHISQYGGRHYRVSEVTAILVPQVLQILSENRSLALLTLSDGDRHRFTKPPGLFIIRNRHRSALVLYLLRMYRRGNRRSHVCGPELFDIRSMGVQQGKMVSVSVTGAI